jgi:hypothetical protein
LIVNSIDDDQGVKPWTIKNIPPDVRNGSIRAAARVDSPIGDYVAQALREKIKRDRESGRQRPELFDPHQNMDSIERMVALAMQLSQLNKGEPPPASLMRQIYALIGKRVKAISEIGHTRLLTGPAAEPEPEPEKTVDGEA